jgi:lipopolysaccharide transport system permease protein
MLILTLITTIGVSSFFSALNVKYRDVRYALPFLVQSLLFITPVIYPVSLVPADWQWVLFLNPLTGVIEVMRATLLLDGYNNWDNFAISAVSGTAILLFGLWYFRKSEREFADII